jgi:hypothetical protein
VTEHACGHKVEHFGVAGYGGWQHFPMQCLECFNQWVDAGLCCECGAPADGGSTTTEAWYAGTCTTYTYRYCKRHWMDVIRPERCQRCGRFVDKDGDCIEVGEIAAYYDPYWGPQPAEPEMEWRCGRCLALEREAVTLAPGGEAGGG